MKALEATRLFAPTLIGVVLALAFVSYMYSIINTTRDQYTESTIEIETAREKFKALENEKKIELAEWLVHEENNAYKKQIDLIVTIKKTYNRILIFLLAGLGLQALSLLSFSFLSHKHTNAINHHGLRFVLTIMCLSIVAAVYFTTKQQLWINDPFKFWTIAVLLPLYISMIWCIYKKSLVIASIFLGITIVSAATHLYTNNYGAVISALAYIYLALEATLSIRGLKAEKNN